MKTKKCVKRALVKASAWLQFEKIRLMPSYNYRLYGPERIVEKLKFYDPHKFPISIGYDAIKWYSENLRADDIFFDGNAISKLGVIVIQAIMGLSACYNIGDIQDFDLNRLKNYYKGDGKKYFIDACKISHAAAHIKNERWSNLDIASPFTWDAPEDLADCIISKQKWDNNLFDTKTLCTILDEHIKEEYAWHKQYSSEELEKDPALKHHCKMTEENKIYKRKMMEKIIERTRYEEGKDKIKMLNLPQFWNCGYK